MIHLGLLRDRLKCAKFLKNLITELSDDEVSDYQINRLRILFSAKTFHQF